MWCGWDGNGGRGRDGRRTATRRCRGTGGRTGGPRMREARTQQVRHRQLPTRHRSTARRRVSGQNTAPEGNRADRRAGDPRARQAGAQLRRRPAPSTRRPVSPLISSPPLRGTQRGRRDLQRQRSRVERQREDPAQRPLQRDRQRRGVVVAEPDVARRDLRPAVGELQLRDDRHLLLLRRGRPRCRPSRTAWRGRAPATPGRPRPRPPLQPVGVDPVDVELVDRRAACDEPLDVRWPRSARCPRPPGPSRCAARASICDSGADTSRSWLRTCTSRSGPTAMWSASTSTLRYRPEIAWVRNGKSLMRTDGSSARPSWVRISRATADSVSAAAP